VVQLTVRVKRVREARTGRNAATGEQITSVARPASVEVRARPLARAKGVLPAAQKTRRRLAADPNVLTSTRANHHGRQSHQPASKRADSRKPRAKPSQPGHDEIAERAYFSPRTGQLRRTANWLRAERELKAT
jgi:hypothetical protein